MGGLVRKKKNQSGNSKDALNQRRRGQFKETGGTKAKTAVGPGVVSDALGTVQPLELSLLKLHPKAALTFAKSDLETRRVST